MKKIISSESVYPQRKEVLKDLSSLDDGIHKMWDLQNRLYQGIVKDNKVLFYVSPMGVVYQNNEVNDNSEQGFKEIGELSCPDDFFIIAKFNKWI